MINIKPFTYTDYLTYEEMVLEPGLIYVAETEVKYGVDLQNEEEEKIDKEHDKIFKSLFSNKKEVAKFINKQLKINGTESMLKARQLEKCNTEFITRKMAKLESDIIYKIKGTETYILIEHQSTVDYKMPKRILEYCVEIIREIDKQKKGIIKIATIYPIVIYTGKRKWKAETEITKMQEEVLEVEKMLKSEYKLVDINEYTEEELLKERSAISKAMLLEKANNENLIDVIKRILKERLNEEEQKFIEEALSTFLKNKIEKGQIEELFEEINKRKGGQEMVIENLERIWNERIYKSKKDGMQIGIKNEKTEIAKRLLKKGMTLEEIQEITQLTKSFIEKLKV